MTRYQTIEHLLKLTPGNSHAIGKLLATFIQARKLARETGVTLRQIGRMITSNSSLVTHICGNEERQKNLT